MPQHQQFPSTLSHGRTQYVLSIEATTGGEMYTVKGKDQPQGPNHGMLSTSASADFEETLLYSWKIKLDPKSGKYFFVNCGGLGKRWRLPDYHEFGFQQEIELFVVNMREKAKQTALVADAAAAVNQPQSSSAKVSAVPSISTRAALNISSLERPWQQMQPFEDPIPLANVVTVASSNNGTPTPTAAYYGRPGSQLAYQPEAMAAELRPTTLSYTGGGSTYLEPGAGYLTPTDPTYPMYPRPASSTTPLPTPKAATPVQANEGDMVRMEQQGGGPTPIMDSLEGSTTLEALREQLRKGVGVAGGVDRQPPTPSALSGGGDVKVNSTPIPQQPNNQPDQTRSILYQQLQAQQHAQQLQAQQQQAALDALTAVVHSLQSMLEGERASKSQLQQQLAERDRVLLERKAADAEAEEDDLRLKVRMLESLAARRREDARLQEFAEDAKYNRDAIIRQKIFPPGPNGANYPPPPLPARSVSSGRGVSEQSAYLY